MDRFEIDEKQNKFKQFLEEEAQKEADFHIDFDMVLEQLEDRLPLIPGKPEIQQQNPRGSYKIDPKTGTNIKITFGKLYPREKTDKKKKKAQKAPARKKDDKPKKPTKWAGPPMPEQPETQKLVDDYERMMNENTFPDNLRGDQ